MSDIGRLLTGRIINALIHDPQMQAMLYERRPRLNADDVRVYPATTPLPEAIREVLPRILVHVMESPFDTEQPSADGEYPYANCAVYLHVITEEYQADLAHRLSSRSRGLLVSTPLSDVAIITSMLVWAGTRAPVRETEFKDAYRLTTEFRAQAGAL